MMIDQILTSFVASAAFGIIFNAPRHSIIKSGFVGMFGWCIYSLLVADADTDAIVATLVAAFAIAIVSQVFAKLYKTPIIIFNVAGIIPLVPGTLAYNSMRNIVENNYALAAQFGAKALMISGAIAMGLVLSEIFNQMIRRVRL
ncbi:threonine/serine exporter family protein [Priestia filamentosa]|uniref:threonine/serine exporter family protein n=1 Tax=Priestia filamentosa TaxID=1402861 RepID=UPI0016029D9A|nr:threonine/serine exporter family protein [Priestia filamentosa]